VKFELFNLIGKHSFNKNTRSSSYNWRI